MNRKNYRAAQTGRCADCVYAEAVPAEAGEPAIIRCMIHKVRNVANARRRCYSARWKDGRKE